mmetsp:Transcript_60018/g.110255  ORF Transcript_60018/g.110255 Transcript_60018/m.110255 type:complete len:228 (-) Transcript_60018:188-871(-)
MLQQQKIILPLTHPCQQPRQYHDECSHQLTSCSRGTLQPECGNVTEDACNFRREVLDGASSSSSCFFRVTQCPGQCLQHKCHIFCAPKFSIASFVIQCIAQHPENGDRNMCILGTTFASSSDQCVVATNFDQCLAVLIIITQKPDDLSRLMRYRSTQVSEIFSVTLWHLPHQVHSSRDSTKISHQISHVSVPIHAELRTYGTGSFQTHRRLSSARSHQTDQATEIII